MKLQGIFPPIATPFDHKGDLYRAKIHHNVDKWNRVALAGYVVCGSTGESVLLTAHEKFQLWEWVAGYAAPGRILIAGTGMESVRETIELTNRAAGLGYQAALAGTPHYYKNLLDNPEAQRIFFAAVADQTKIPLIIHNWPQATGIDIPVEAVAALSEHPNILAVHESSGSLEKIGKLARETREGFQVLAGSAPLLWESLAAGASGGILALANAAPYALITIWEAFRTRDQDLGLDWQNRIRHAAELVTVRYGIPGLKHAMDLMGYYGGPPRLPLTPLPPAARKEIEQAFDGLRG